MRQSHSIVCCPAAWDMACAASARHAGLELEIAALVIGEPSTVVPIGRSMRAESLFSQGDLLAIYDTCCKTEKLKWTDTLLAVQDRLIADEFFDYSDPPAFFRTCRWGSRSIYSLAMEWHGAPGMAAIAARSKIGQLIELHRLMLRANRAHVEAKELMNQAATAKLALRCAQRKRMVA